MLPSGSFLHMIGVFYDRISRQIHLPSKTNFGEKAFLKSHAYTGSYCCLLNCHSLWYQGVCIICLITWCL
uniref:Uncharacterized protein n=1 Tax=Anguilla anguilla TaxID=7936 RepID=A0A0E9XAL8_ANGAN